MLCCYRPSILCPEELCSVSTQSCDIAFLKSACEGSPTHVQGDTLHCRLLVCDLCPPCHVGDRVRHMLCEVDPNKQLYSDSSTQSSEGSDMDYSSAGSDEERSTVSSMTMSHTQYCPFTTPLPLTDFPSSCYHHTGKTSLSSRKTSSSVAITAGRRSEIARQISHLLSPSSPLVGENLKVTPPFPPPLV